tara:strand:+ start:1188 stop:1778 length:591 start_codon:yes stop_codon:yes gene_type:complete
MKINELETGDIILFNGNYFMSHIIEYFTSSIYSHVGIILKNPDLGDATFEGIYLLESGRENTPDPENNRIKKGVQIINLEEKIKNFNGQIYVRKLHCTRDKEFYEKIKNIHSAVHNIPYDLNPIDWIKADLQLDIGNTHKTNTYWCSALVTYVYVKLGFLDKNIPWSLISPQDLSSSCNKLKFINCILDKDKDIIY